MIQTGTILTVIDNSGARKVRCLKVLKGYRKRYAFIGDVIVVAVKRLRRKRRIHSRVLKGDIVKALIIRTKVGLVSFYNERLSFNENSVVLLNKQNKLIGTRIFGPIPKYFRRTRFLKVVSVSSGILK